MKLPNGITGFYDSAQDMSPQIDADLFRKLCFDFVFRNNGKLIDFQQAQTPLNFLYAYVEVSGHHFYILLNQHYPYLACASAIEYGNMVFMNQPDVHQSFSSFYQILDTDNLNSRYDQQLLQQWNLNKAEVKQIAYWNPATIGQIVFNHWD
ncbi:hypothetical protein JMA_09610 [Jeotgalibacillus malaysiensis]|uniref:Uncharacterized protein n=1 Tax=Jeotgalibacillus malaysiensis TaxID=1508404 RepID=A0A0B5AP20_9BACL|nr:hypothetical protein [Jeotgalibacillus malaysiensis]AJD90278.1 hypothetical protein JMA_09610 [Jeotgalibacillus malaysiensis]